VIWTFLFPYLWLVLMANVEGYASPGLGPLSRIHPRASVDRPDQIPVSTILWLMVVVGWGVVNKT
jgi:hypothetical protein